MVSIPATDVTAKTKTKVFGVLAGKVFDSQQRRIVKDQVIMIDRDLGVILDVLSLDEFRLAQRSDDDIDLIDLGQWTLVPGFVDAHVHCKTSISCIQSQESNRRFLVFLHAYAETPWEDQVTKESLAERTIRATVHAHKTLMAGFTTVR